ncbi:TPA: hypothetical protein ACH3X1_001900 [Trebouxia sp. C0004]
MNGTTQTIVLHSAPYLSGSSIESTLQGQDTNLRQLTIVTSSASLKPNAIPQQTFDQAFSSAHSSGYHSTVLLGFIAAALKPGATLTVREPASGGLNESAAPLKKALLLAGFVESTNGKLMNTPQGQLVSANKPQYAVGARASITLKPKAETKRTSWNLAADEDNDELLDEDELLTEEDRQRPAVIAMDDCEVGAGKKACKNCTCGRADAEAAVQKVDLSQDMLENPQSACGSCGLGDAFRCSSCPYRGLPSFEMGKKIELGSDFLTADA